MKRHLFSVLCLGVVFLCVDGCRGKKTEVESRAVAELAKEAAENYFGGFEDKRMGVERLGTYDLDHPIVGKGRRIAGYEDCPLAVIFPAKKRNKRCLYVCLEMDDEGRMVVVGISEVGEDAEDVMVMYAFDVLDN